jgi:serine/arginine repetitive matrix protein 1
LPQPKIKEIQIQLTGFLNKETPAFCKELWDLMLSAQDSAMGVPRELLEAKKLELQQEQVSRFRLGESTRLTQNTAIQSRCRATPSRRPGPG